MCIHQQHHILESDRLPSRQYNADDQNGLLKTVFLLCNGLALINLFRFLKLVSKKKDIRIQILQCFKTNDIRIQILQYFKRKGIQILQNFKRNRYCNVSTETTLEYRYRNISRERAFRYCKTSRETTLEYRYCNVSREKALKCRYCNVSGLHLVIPLDPVGSIMKT